MPRMEVAMTAYLLLNAALWGCATVLFVALELTEYPTESPPMKPMPRPKMLRDWRDAVWLLGLVGMTLWPIVLIYAR
jgi:hypothetical protein